MPALERPFQASVMLDLARQIVNVELDETAQRALGGCSHPPELRALATRDGLLHPDVKERTTLERVLELYPLEPC